MLNATGRLARRLCRRRAAQPMALGRALRCQPPAHNAAATATRQLHVTAPARHDMAARAESFARGKLRGEQPYEVAIKPLESFLGRAVRPEPQTDLTEDEIVALLRHTDRHVVHALYTLANTLTNRFFEKKVHFRGLLEFSNVCQKDCGYCGIRKHAKGVHRYTMTRPQIVETAMWAFENGYGSVMLQSGELVTDSRMAMVEAVIRDIRQSTIERDIANRVKLQRERAQRAQTAGTPATASSTAGTAAATASDLYIPPVPPKDFGATAKREQWLPYSNVGLGVALSLGELNYDLYQRMFDAGAHRYLLRIETSNPELYAALHPADHSHAYRIQCLKWLKQIGYQIGTGIMIGLPDQTERHLAQDLRFFRDIGADMIGMGPYICAPGTPTGERWTELNKGVDISAYNKQSFERATRMVALARVFLGNVTVAATTALQAINPAGREIALMRGANILMPLLTPGEFRADYQLYRNKPCIDEVASDCRGCLTARVKMADKEIAWGEWGDPHHFFFDISGNRLQPAPTASAVAEAAAPVRGSQDHAGTGDSVGSTRLPELPAEWRKRVQPVPAIVLENELKANAPKVAPTPKRPAHTASPANAGSAAVQTAHATA